MLWSNYGIGYCVGASYGYRFGAWVKLAGTVVNAVVVIGQWGGLISGLRGVEDNFTGREWFCSEDGGGRWVGGWYVGPYMCNSIHHGRRDIHASSSSSSDSICASSSQRLCNYNCTQLRGEARRHYNLYSSQYGQYSHIYEVLEQGQHSQQSSEQLCR